MTAIKRNPGESEKLYKERIKNIASMEREYQKGYIIWHAYKGTYVKAKHGKLVLPRFT